MRIFLTGATGYVGSAALEALVRAGHDVTALARNNEKAADVAARGGHPVVGDLFDAGSYLQAAAGHDGYIHAAAEESPRAAALDRATTEMLVAAARDSRGAFFIYTSGVWVLGSTRGPAAEDAPVNPTPRVAWRPAHERFVLEAAGEGLRTVVVRPGIVYGGSRGIIGDLFRDASNGLMRVVGGGENHWPLVYDRDLGELYARLAAHPEASGVYHATDETDERVNDLVEAIAAVTPHKPDVRHMPLAEARKKLGDYADALVLDQIVRSPRARALGWSPALHSVTRNVPRLFEEWRTEREAA